MGTHCSVARSSRHTSLTGPLPSYPPLTTSPGSVPSHSFTPARDVLHTAVSRHAPTKPLCRATRAQISTRARTCWTAQVLMLLPIGGRHRRSLYAVRGSGVCRCAVRVVSAADKRCEDSSKKTCHLIISDYCLFCAEKSFPHPRSVFKSSSIEVFKCRRDLFHAHPLVSIHPWVFGRVFNNRGLYLLLRHMVTELACDPAPSATLALAVDRIDKEEFHTHTTGAVPFQERRACGSR
jgi:hypothetical protein